MRRSTPYCTYHPDRFGVGICVRCRKVICAECATRVEGINHCHACLEELAVRPAPVAAASRGWQWMVLILSWLGMLGMLWRARGGLYP